MTFDEFKEELSKNKRDELLKLAWNWFVIAHECKNACLFLQKEHEELIAISDFMAEIIERNGLNGELKGKEIEQYKKQREQDSAQRIEVINQAFLLSNSSAIEENKSSTARAGGNAKHANEKKEQQPRIEKIQKLWASGEYDSRDDCAEQEWKDAGFKSIGSARHALRNTPDATTGLQDHKKG
ncbi:MAG: hypothetical protein FWD62_11770 [Betaproteobacteria bacterium]|nr:hypothetical protein [Betaproteobacteria bacterium]